MVHSITFEYNGIKKNTKADWNMIPMKDPYEFLMKFGNVTIEARIADIKETLSKNPTAFFANSPNKVMAGTWEFKVSKIDIGAIVKLSFTEANSKWVEKDASEKKQTTKRANKYKEAIENVAATE